MNRLGMEHRKLSDMLCNLFFGERMFTFIRTTFQKYQILWRGIFLRYLILNRVVMCVKLQLDLLWHSVLFEFSLGTRTLGKVANNIKFRTVLFMCRFYSIITN